MFKIVLTSQYPRSHIDSARMYGNEAQVGEAVRESGIPRSQIYISASSFLSTSYHPHVPPRNRAIASRITHNRRGQS